MIQRYGPHPSKELNAIFLKQQLPFQGKDPYLSQVIFVGIDANYSAEISSHPDFMSSIYEYHRDGVAFWEKYKVHHPFLLDSYPLKRNTGGVPYHRKFSWLGLDASFASKISFIELLPFPTTGRTERDIFWKFFDKNHASKIDDLVFKGERRIILISSSLAKNYMVIGKKKYGVFSWLPSEFKYGEMARIGSTLIYGAPHFSSTQFKRAIFEGVGACVREFCAN